MPRGRLKTGLRVAFLGLFGLAGAAACDGGCSENEEAPKPDAGDDAAEPPPPPPPPKDGCLRGASLEGVETDPACAVKQPPSEDTVRAAMKQLEVTVTADATEVYAGGAMNMTLVIQNLSPSNDAFLWLESRPRMTGAHTDWSRMVGVPVPKDGANEPAKLLFPITTTDPWDRDVDGVPTTGSGAAPAPTPLLVRIRPGGKLQRKIEWFALRIPAPPPMFQDDAGHRFYPKTLAMPLTPGEYGVAIDLPFFALSKEERKQTLRVKVLPQHPDAGAFRR